MPEAALALSPPTPCGSSGKWGHSTAPFRRVSSGTPAELSTSRRGVFALFGAVVAAGATIGLPALASGGPESEMLRLFRQWAVLAQSSVPNNDIAFDRLRESAMNAKVADARDEAALGWMIALAMLGGRTLDGDGMMPHLRITPLHDQLFGIARRYPELATIAQGSVA